ncbi:MAG: winged helix-turn-helix domain-containing protein [Gammaproteobacteria bacterium]
MSRAGVEVHLRPQSFDVLCFLAANAGRLVARNEIFAAVWGGTVVTDDSLTQCLIDIRRAIGDGSREVIRTVPRRGYVFELPVQKSGGSPVSPEPAGMIARRLFRYPWVAVLAAPAVVLLVWFSVAPKVVDEPGAAPARANSIAVLAFVDMSEGRDHEYFADGVAEEILNLLTRIPELDVVARTSSFSFKGKDTGIAEIGKALDVAFVLEGSVRRSDERVRVTAQLVDAATSTHIWSETCDRNVGDLLAVQGEIAQSVADSLKLTLTQGGLAGSAHAMRKFADEVDASAGFGEIAFAVNHALEHYPASAEAQVRAAHYHFQMGDFARSNLAGVLVLARSYDESARELQRAKELHPARQAAISPGLERFPLDLTGSSLLHPLHEDPRWQRYLWQEEP